MNWYLNVLKNYTNFTGRARRKEYWMFLLFHYLIIFLFTILIALSSETFSNSSEMDTFSIILVILLMLYFLGTILPFLAVTARRLHDTDKSAWWYLICIIPYIGRFIIFIFTCMDSYGGTNKWGPNPKKDGSDVLINQIGRE